MQRERVRHPWVVIAICRPTPCATLVRTSSWVEKLEHEHHAGAALWRLPMRRWVGQCSVQLTGRLSSAVDSDARCQSEVLVSKSTAKFCRLLDDRQLAS